MQISIVWRRTHLRRDIRWRYPSRLSYCYSQLSRSVNRGTRPVEGCARRRFSLLQRSGRSDRIATEGGTGLDGPKRPHFARHTRRCSTRLFAEALKRSTHARTHRKTNTCGQLVQDKPLYIMQIRREFKIAFPCGHSLQEDSLFVSRYISRYSLFSDSDLVYNYNCV